ncbi:MAG: RidA family protein [Candidatus Competibacteraceae bacterium]|nr:RidA family protein [Candidatus Competibacteraceae bacterium]MCB1806619.1 RidA family protein [Candidatus Competibacteraceae bacterium]MCB1810854.1 RidA family protein [Candidatus Competibacteraceae bacterium]
MSITEKLQALGYTLPAPAQPAFNYVPVTVHQGVAYVSGQLPKEDGEVRIQGKVGAEVDLTQASHAARVCILQALACLQAELGDLNRITQILKVNGYVASAPGFNAQPKVLDAASTLLVELFGAPGRHARAAVGVAELPRNAPVEIELTVAVTTGETQ